MRSPQRTIPPDQAPGASDHGGCGTPVPGGGNPPGETGAVTNGGAAVCPATCGRRRAGWLALAPWHLASLFCALVLLANLNGYRLLDPDEGRYAEIPREMIESADYVLPRLNYVAYLEKPPLMYWATVASFRLLGAHEWALRLVPALCAVLGMAVAWWLTLLCFGRASARWAPPIIASTVAYFVIARIPIIDMMFSVLLAASLTAWLGGEHARGRKQALLWGLSGLVLGAAVLAKGPVAAVLFAGIVLGYLLWTRRAGDLPLGLGLPLLVAGAAFVPWCVAAQQADPRFYHYFFVVQHFDRFLGRGTPEHVRPFYFYAALLPPAFGVWSLYWPGMLRAARRLWPGLPERRRHDGLFLLLWSAVVLLFFSASTCKLFQYVLPLWWPVVALTAAWAERERRSPQPRRSLHRPALAGALLLAVVVPGAAVYAYRQQEVAMSVLQRPLLVFAACGLAAFALLLRGALAARRRFSPACLAVGAILPLAGLLPAQNAVCLSKDLNGLIPPQLLNLPADTPWTIAQWRTYNQSLAYYTHRRVVVIDAINEIKLGLGEPGAAYWFRRGEGAIDDLAARGPLALVAKAHEAEQVARRHRLYLYRMNHDQAMLFNESGRRLLAEPPPAKPASGALDGAAARAIPD